MPNVFERECTDKIKNGIFNYSEIFLNKNARPLGVFYTDECQDIEEVKMYAQMYNLPLVKITTKKNKQK